MGQNSAAINMLEKMGSNPGRNLALAKVYATGDMRRRPIRFSHLIPQTNIRAKIWMMRRD
jgi:hypothetical protein